MKYYYVIKVGSSLLFLKGNGKWGMEKQGNDAGVFLKHVRYPFIINVPFVQLARPY
jgi:hypothetical protein